MANRKQPTTNNRLPDAASISAARAKYAASRIGIDPVKADKDEIIRKCPRMTREQFELRIVNIETSYQMAYEAAKALDYLKCDARDLARQRRMNMMIDSQICMLEDETNVTVATRRMESVGSVPYPPAIEHTQTMLNFDNNR